MLTEEIQDTCAKFTIRVVEPAATGREPLFQTGESRDEGLESAYVKGPLFEYATNSPATLAERFPRLMVCVLSASVILTAITMEIEWLRAAGYYWP